MNTNSSITNSDWLEQSTRKLKAAGIRSARLDSLLILEEVLRLPRIKLLTKQDITFSDKQLEELNLMLERRLKDEPMSYIRGYSEFFGREFTIDSTVLVPRPESEAFIELARSINLDNDRIADIGTGSGCLGITFKLEFPSIDIELFDISPEAIETTKSNLKKFKLNLSCKVSNLLDDVDGNFDIYIANLPYVPDEMKNLKNLSFEPPISLFAGSDGMDIYKLFWQQIKIRPNKPRYVITESLISQHHHMIKLAESAKFSCKNRDGLVQLFELN